MRTAERLMNNYLHLMVYVSKIKISNIQMHLDSCCISSRTILLNLASSCSTHKYLGTMFGIRFSRIQRKQIQKRYRNKIIFFIWKFCVCSFSNLQNAAERTQCLLRLIYLSLRMLNCGLELKSLKYTIVFQLRNNDGFLFS